MNTSVTTPQGVRHEISKGELSVDKIYKAEYQKEGTLSAQIRQAITTKSFYPSKKVASSLQANIFGTEDFGFENKEYTAVENRVAWIPVPPNATMEVVIAKIQAAQKNGACIYRVLANAPILDENQKYAIEQGFKTKDDFANTQVVRYPEGTKNETGDDIGGKITLDKAGKVQYRRTFFWLTAMEDQDARGMGEVYLSAEIAAELKGASVLAGQTI